MQGLLAHDDESSAQDVQEDAPDPLYWPDPHAEQLADAALA